MALQIHNTFNAISIGDITQSEFANILKSYKNAQKVVITDENTHEYSWPYLLTSFEGLNTAEVIVLPNGEENKDIEICEQVWDTLLDYDIQRSDLIINLGGGVITDLGGFIASVYKRGIRFINIPTSLLAMVDASVGGKTGVNFRGFKNQLGVFALPQAVFCDPIFLKTLPENEVLSGKAEMLKHGLIASAPLWKEMLKFKEKLPDKQLLHKAILIKSDIVEQDFNEKNERKKLNFGHTIGHALESRLLNKDNPATHGECVAWGMLVESYLSVKHNHLSESEFEMVKDLISSWYSPLPISKDDFPALLQLMKQDKKNKGDLINFTLLKEIGNAEINKELKEDEIEKGLAYIFG
ncbi:MAG: 3-dehydroquinate synthase [Brumimicrobium sp.]|nr:3-dehydroquinate synthase [Brumimicrobium sp.]